MKLSDVENIFQRAIRLRDKNKEKAGSGASWFYTFEDNETHQYVLNGIKTFDEIQDDIESTFVWLWSLKDYVKKYSVKKGKSSQWVEDKVNLDQTLCICADIANSSKHGSYDRKGRSNKYPKLGKLNYFFPHNAIGKITVYAFKVETDITNPNLTEFTMDILDENNNRLGDVFEYLDYGIIEWGKIINEVNNIA